MTWIANTKRKKFKPSKGSVVSFFVTYGHFYIDLKNLILFTNNIFVYEGMQCALCGWKANRTASLSRTAAGSHHANR
jgi:hypothetical protein